MKNPVNKLAQYLKNSGLEEWFMFSLLVLSIYMIWESSHFSFSAAGTFPRIAAGIIIIGCILLIFQSYLPTSFQTWVSEDSKMFGQGETQENIPNADFDIESSDVRSDTSIQERPINNPLFTSLTALIYGALAYMIGFLWASPIFVLVYTRWFKLPRLISAVLIILSFVIVYVFMTALNIPLDQGQYFITKGIDGIR